MPQIGIEVVDEEGVDINVGECDPVYIHNPKILKRYLISLTLSFSAGAIGSIFTYSEIPTWGTFAGILSLSGNLISLRSYNNAPLRSLNSFFVFQIFFNCSKLLSGSFICFASSSISFN